MNVFKTIFACATISFFAGIMAEEVALLTHDEMHIINEENTYCDVVASDVDTVCQQEEVKLLPAQDIVEAIETVSAE